MEQTKNTEQTEQNKKTYFLPQNVRTALSPLRSSNKIIFAVPFSQYFQLMMCNRNLKTYQNNWNNVNFSQTIKPLVADYTITIIPNHITI